MRQCVHSSKLYRDAPSEVYAYDILIVSLHAFGVISITSLKFGDLYKIWIKSYEVFQHLR